MELLAESSRDDLLSGVIRALRVRSTLFCHSKLAAPWGFNVEARTGSAFHLLLFGECVLDLESHRPLRLSSGDLVILPRGHTHALKDRPETPAPALERIIAAEPSFDGRLQIGGDGAPTELLCGGFELEGESANPVLALLPTVVRIPGRDGRPAPALAGVVALLQDELRERRPGGEGVITRMTDLLVAQALREQATGALGDPPIATLADPEVGRAVGLLHDHPERHWTVSALAREVSLSRSAFAERFTALTGDAPMRYLRRLRLARAAGLLRDTDLSLAAIARRTGYDSEVSLSRAFKREYGVPPGRYRVREDEPTVIAPVS